MPWNTRIKRKRTARYSDEDTFNDDVTGKTYRAGKVVSVRGEYFWVRFCIWFRFWITSQSSGKESSCCGKIFNCSTFTSFSPLTMSLNSKLRSRLRLIQYCIANHLCKFFFFLQVYIIAIILTWLLSLFTFSAFIYSDWIWNDHPSCTPNFLQMIANLCSLPFILVRYLLTVVCNVCYTSRVSLNWP